MTITRGNAKWWAYIRTFNRQGMTSTIQLGSGKDKGDIIGFDAYKSIAGAGTLRMELVPHRTIDYLTAIRPNAVVEFWVDNGDGEDPSCQSYFVDRVSRVRSAHGENKVSHRIHISCTDWTKIWRMLSTYYYTSLTPTRVRVQAHYTMQALAKRAEAIFDLGDPDRYHAAFFSPSDYFLVLTAAFFAGIQHPPSTPLERNRTRLGMDMVIPDPFSDSTFRGLLHPLEVVDLGGMVAHPSTFYYMKPIGVDRGALGAYSHLWDMIRANSLPLLNELFVDTRPDNEIPKGISPSVALESAPFGRVPFQPTISRQPDLLTSQGLSPQPIQYLGTLMEQKSTVTWAPRVILRKRPYHGRDLVDITAYPITHEIPTQEMQSFDIGISDHDVKNLFAVFARIRGQNMDHRVNLGGLDAAIINPDSIGINGLRIFTPDTDFPYAAGLDALPNSAVKSAIAVQRVLKQMTVTVAQWYNRNDELLNGTIQLPRMRFDIRVGRPLDVVDNLRPQDDPYVFYIESVGTRSRTEEGSSTTIGVVRGRPRSEAQQEEEEISSSSAEGVQGGFLQYIRYGQRISFNPPL